MRPKSLPLLVLLLAGCSEGTAPPPAPASSLSPPSSVAQVPALPLPKGSDPVSLNPSEFTSQITNPYFPLKPGATWVYQEDDGAGAKLRIEVTVAAQTKRIMGIEARIVHDVVTEDGAVVEDTFDWYAQDRAGNVWYLGEDTREYEDGKLVSTKGSWLAGENGAMPGIIMAADPRPGLTYRQEYYRGQAEDGATVVSVGDSVTVPIGTFTNALTTEEFTPLEPDLRERKVFAAGVGAVLTVTLSGGKSRSELVSYTG